MISLFERQASHVAYGASTVSIISGFTINEWGVIGGLLLATLTFLVNWYYRHKAYKLAELTTIVEEVLEDIEEKVLEDIEEEEKKLNNKTIPKG